jgi:hypothetical protein
MSLRQAQQQLEQASAHCKFVSFYQGLDKDDKSVFDEWVSEKKPAGWISRVVKAGGLFINEKTLKRHLDGVCHCPEGTAQRGVYQ